MSELDRLVSEFEEEHGRAPKFGELRGYPGRDGIPTRRRNDFRWVNPEELMYPKDNAFVQVLRNRHWIAKYDDDKYRVLMFGKNPMANSDKRVAERVLPSYEDEGATDLLFLPLTFVEIDMRDY